MNGHDMVPCGCDTCWGSDNPVQYCRYCGSGAGEVEDTLCPNIPPSPLAVPKEEEVQ